jgi:hypothetical protein
MCICSKILLLLLTTNFNLTAISHTAHMVSTIVL